MICPAGGRWEDLVQGKRTVSNALYRNDGDGTFEETGLFEGAAFSDDGTAQGSMGVDFGDYDRDGLLDIYITHFSDDYNTLFRNLGQGRFRDMTRGAGLTFSSWPMVGWGTGFADLDHDGWEDIFAANGHVFPQVDGYKFGTSFHQRSQVFRNLGDGKFQEVSAGLDKLKSWHNFPSPPPGSTGNGARALLRPLRLRRMGLKTRGITGIIYARNA